MSVAVQCATKGDVNAVSIQIVILWFGIALGIWFVLRENARR